MPAEPAEITFRIHVWSEGNYYLARMVSYDGREIALGVGKNGPLDAASNAAINASNKEYANKLPFDIPLDRDIDEEIARRDAIVDPYREGSKESSAWQDGWDEGLRPQSTGIRDSATEKMAYEQGRQSRRRYEGLS